MTGYGSSIKLDENTGAHLSYFDNRMRLTLRDYIKRREKVFFREGANEETMKKNLLEVSGVAKLIRENYEEIVNNLKKDAPKILADRGFKSLWGLID